MGASCSRDARGDRDPGARDGSRSNLNRTLDAVPLRFFGGRSAAPQRVISGATSGAISGAIAPLGEDERVGEQLQQAVAVQLQHGAQDGLQRVHLVPRRALEQDLLVERWATVPL